MTFVQVQEVRLSVDILLETNIRTGEEAMPQETMQWQHRETKWKKR